MWGVGVLLEICQIANKASSIVRSCDSIKMAIVEKICNNVDDKIVT